MLDQLRTENSERDICRVPIALCAVPTHKIKLRKKPDPIQIVAVGLARSLNLPVEDVPANVFADIHLCHLTEKMWWRPGAGGPQLNNAHQLRLELNVLKKNVKIFISFTELQGHTIYPAAFHTFNKISMRSARPSRIDHSTAG